MTAHQSQVNKLDITQRQDSGQIMANFILKALVNNTKTQLQSIRHSMKLSSSTKRSRLRARKNIQDPTQADMIEKLRVMKPSKVVLLRKNQNWKMSITNIRHTTDHHTHRATMHQEA